MREEFVEKKKKGIGLFTPSAPAPALFPDRYKRGVSCLENMGFEVICGSYVTSLDEVVSASAKQRAADINNLFSDDNVSILMATIGGDYSAEILPYLNWEAIRANKKGVIGYSDITVLLHVIGIKGQQVVFYGPTLMTEFSEYPIPPDASKESFTNIFKKKEDLEISPSSLLMSEGSDWAFPPTERKLSCPVFQKIIRSGQANGIVVGGCIEALERLRGTEFWPSFEDSILLMETPDDEFDEKKWRCLIADYINLGVFKKIVGIVVGQKMWQHEEVEKLSSMLLNATNERKVPILYGLPFGHISPIATIPLFARATLDTDRMKLIFKKPFKYEYIER